MSIVDDMEAALKKRKQEMAKKHTGRRLTAKESREKTKHWPRYNKKADEASEKADPGWRNADTPSLTKGHAIYKKHS